MIEHTSGPWHPTKTRHQWRVCHKEGIVATIERWTEPIDEADAHLIAAAPDMLAVLNAARIVLKNRDQDEREAKLLEAIKAAIAKATGQ